VTSSQTLAVAIADAIRDPEGRRLLSALAEREPAGAASRPPGCAEPGHMARGTGGDVSTADGWEAAALAAASEQDRAAFTIAADIFEARWYAEHPDVPRITQDGPAGPGEGKDTADGPRAAHGPQAGLSMGTGGAGDRP